VRLIRAAASDYVGTAQFAMCDDKPGNENCALGSGATQVEVPLLTVDSLLEDNADLVAPGRTVDFLTIDTEGFDPLVRIFYSYGGVFLQLRVALIACACMYLWTRC
jgi:hypothetical protein